MNIKNTKRYFSAPKPHLCREARRAANSDMFKDLVKGYLECTSEEVPEYLISYSELMRSGLVSTGIATRRSEWSHKNFVEGDGWNNFLDTSGLRLESPLIGMDLLLEDENGRDHKILMLTLKGVAILLASIPGTTTRHIASKVRSEGGMEWLKKKILDFRSHDLKVKLS